jgi:hypothetical protein
MASNVVLTFDNILVVDKTLIITFDIGGGNSLVCTETFKDDRIASYQTTIGPTTSIQASEYIIAWNYDWRDEGDSGNLLAFKNANSVTITLGNDAWQVTSVTGTAVSGADVSYVINNDPVEDEKTVDISGWTLHASPCISIYADIDVTGGNDIYDVYLDGVLVQSAQTTPLQVLTTRGLPQLLKIIDTLGAVIDEQIIRPPSKILESQIELTTQVLSGGTTVTVAPLTVHTALLPLEYKLEGGVYSASNVFAGLAAGTFTVYVKDVFGCETTKEFVLDGVSEVVNTVFSMSDINPIRYAKVETGKKNHKNTLSCHEVRQLKYPFFHRYLDADTPVTQFKTNAAYINAYTIDPDLNQIGLTPIKMTENTGLEAKSTSTYFDLGSGRSAIYFGVVDILNVLTDAVDDTIDFGFTLPEWADTIGDIVNIEGIGDVAIDNIGYSDFYDAFILEFALAYSGVAVTKKVYAQYNIQPYEVYEFATIMSAQPDLFNVVLEVGTDSGNIEYCVISEKIKKVVDYDNLYDIDYYDSANKGGMVYQTGVQHKIRLEGISDYVGEQETEGYDGDTDYFITNNVVYDSQNFTFFRLTGEMCAKLRLIVTHETLIINGLSYRLSESPEITTNKNNNLKTFSVNLKRSGDLFLTDEQEIIVGTAESDSIAAALEASKGKSLLLWTKLNG